MTTLKKFLEKPNVDFTASKHAVFTFGRFNPPTKGHGHLIDSVKSLAEDFDGDHFIFPSHAIDKPLKRTGRVNPESSKNPLPLDVKIGFMRQVFPDTNIVEDGPKNPWDVPEWLGERGYTDIKMIVGDDQIADFKRLVESTSKHFNSFEVFSAGIRNPDASDVTGMSATKARQAALTKDIGKFRVATGWSGETAEKLMEATRICMGAVSE
jgi:hypothetical protein